MWKALFDDFLGYGLMGVGEALHQGHCAGKHGDVTAQYAFYQFWRRRELFALGPPVQVRVYHRGLCHSRVDGKSGVL